MSGNGQAPFRSAWLWPPRTRLRRADAMFHQNINFSDPDNTEATIWTTWFFGASTTAAVFFPFRRRPRAARIITATRPRHRSFAALFAPVIPSAPTFVPTHRHRMSVSARIKVRPRHRQFAALFAPVFPSGPVFFPFRKKRRIVAAKPIARKRRTFAALFVPAFAAPATYIPFRRATRIIDRPRTIIITR